MTSPSHEERAQKGHRPGNDAAEGFGALARRLGSRASASEERLEELLAERRRELEEHAGRFEEVVTDVQRREELVRDARTSVERVLRVGAADLEAREADLAELAQELAVREQRAREEEAGLARRRGELGAVELKRAAVEQREEAIAAREAQVSAREAGLEEREASAGPQTSADDDTPSPLLLFVPGASYRLVVIEHPSVGRGDALEVDGEAYRVGRVGSSPLPGDRRRCAYLVREPRAAAPPVESS